MSLSTLRAAIVARLSAVPGIGVVHAFERYASGQAEFRALYLSGGKILGWHVHRDASQERRVASGRGKVDHTWLIRGFMALSDGDASALAFDDLIEAIRDAFRADPTLGGVLPPCYGGEGEAEVGVVQLASSGPVMFAGVLCHGAELRLVTRGYA